MYSNGLSECCDTVNNIERVVVPVLSPPSVGNREYTVRVIANELVEDDQQVRVGTVARNRSALEGSLRRSTRRFPGRPRRRRDL